jgi:HSP20 family molecular chaperone IbpA
VDLIENADELWVFIDLPGFQREEVTLEGDAQTLHISAARPAEVEEGRSVLVNERYAQVDRVIPLPTTVDIEDADAIFEDGACKITLPKAAADRYQEIGLRSA